MKGFQIKEDQIVMIVAALTADELARRFGRYTETLTVSRWNASTPLGRNGVGATSDQRDACAERAAQFFEVDQTALGAGEGDTFGDWAKRLLRLISGKLTHFRFHPATPAGFVDTRHGADDIYQDAAAVASLIDGRRRALSLVPPHTLMGLVSSVIVPNLSGIELVDVRAMEPDKLGSFVGFGDVIIATPTLWRYLAETLPGLASNVMGLSFGEKMGPELASRLRAKGLGTMRELYGSTETGVVAWRDSPPEPFRLFGHWSREGNAIIRRRADDRRQTMLPMDDLQWQDDQSFDIGPRRDGAVQIGAVNVFPKSIAAIIGEHPDVRDCVVRVSRRSGKLDRLIADITIDQRRRPDQSLAWAIDEWCRARLKPTERPRIYNFIEMAAPKTR